MSTEIKGYRPLSRESTDRITKAWKWYRENMGLEGDKIAMMKKNGASNLFASANKPHDLFIEFHPSFLPLPKFDTTYEDEYLRVIDSGYSLVAHHKRHGQVLCHFTARI